MAALFVVYGAPDSAQTQVVVETLTTVVFVLVLRRLPERFERQSTSRRRYIRLGVAGLVWLTVFLFTIVAAEIISGAPALGGGGRPLGARRERPQRGEHDPGRLPGGATPLVRSPCSPYRSWLLTNDDEVEDEIGRPCRGTRRHRVSCRTPPLRGSFQGRRRALSRRHSTTGSKNDHLEVRKQGLRGGPPHSAARSGSCPDPRHTPVNNFVGVVESGQPDRTSHPTVWVHPGRRSS